jgi:glucokinase
MNGPALIGIDVGGTKIAGVVVIGDQAVDELRRPLDGGDLGDQVVAMVRELAARSGARPAAIGIAAPGQVDPDRGVIEMAVNLGVRDLPIARLVTDALGVPSAVEHDARAVALLLAEEPSMPARLAYVSVGTGISAGVMVDGALVRGNAGLAGEIGHVVADPAGERCACGLIGCLETVASGPAVARAAARALAGGAPSTLAPDATSIDVYRAATAGDPLACAVVESAAAHLAAAIRGLALTFGLDRVVVGGGVAQAGPTFSAPLIAAIELERAGSRLVARALAESAIEVLGDSRPIGALGAVTVARRLAAVAAGPSEEVGTR